jgi:peptidoglycan/LPS O-acetylase OafA/YrhL
MWLFGYFSPIASFYKMLLGSLVRLSPSVDVLRKRYTAWVGFSILTLSLVACIPKTAYDLQQIGLDSQYFGYLIFIEPTACFSAVLIIVGSLDGNSFLESRFLRFIGRISYPLYLYQMPILHIKNWPRGWDAVSLSSLALVAATVSTLYLEEPLREAYRKWKTRKQDFV